MPENYDQAQDSALTKRILQWFDTMVSQGRMDPANPDLTLLPDHYLRALVPDLTPDEHMDPNDAMVTVCLFLLLSIHFASGVKEVRLKKAEIELAINVFGLMLAMEELKRCGLLNYKTEPGWHNGKGQVWVTDFRKVPPSHFPLITPN